MLLIGSRHRHLSCSEAYRFARSGRSRPIRRSTSTVRTPLLGFIDRPFADTTVTASTPAWAVAQTSVRDCHVPNVFRSCRSSRLQRFATQRADPKTHSFDCPRVCCTPQPAMGFTTFRTPCSASRPSADPKVVDLAVHPEVVPCGEDPSKRSPPRQPDHVVTASRPFGRDRVHRLVCPPAVPSRTRFRVATVRCAALRPQGFLPPRSPLRCARRCRCAPARCSLGLWIDSFSMLPRVSRCPAFLLDVSPGGPNRFGVPGPERRGKAGCFGPVWLLRPMLGISPKGNRSGSRWLRHLPKKAPRPHSTMPDGMPVDLPREEGPPRRSRHPKVQGCRRHRDASPKRLVRDPALAPKSGVRWFELVLPILPRSPAYLMVRPLAADAHARGRGRLRATRAHPEGCGAEPSGANPEGSERGASRRHHPKVGPWRLVAPAPPASWRAGSGQTVIVFTGTAETRSEDEVSPPIRRSG